MKFEIRLVGRYLRAQKTRPLARLTAWLAIIGTAFGVAAFIVAQGLANGFHHELQEKILANTAHILVYRTDGTDFANFAELETQIKLNKAVKDISPTTFHNAILTKDGSFNYAVLRAVSESKIQNSMSEPPAVAGGLNLNTPRLRIEIGAELAEKAGLKIGDAAKIMAASAFDEMPNSFEAVIVGIFKTGLYEYDSTWIYLSLADSAKIIGRNKPTATALSININDIYEAERVAGEIQNWLGTDFKVLSWQVANRPLFAAMNLEKRVVLWIISLIVLLAILNITTNLALLVNDRREDIAILRTFGAKTRTIISIFLLEGLILGIIGAICGVCLGLLICLAGNRLQIISLPKDVYSVEFVRFLPNVFEIFSAIFGVLILSLAASFFPAFLATKIKPWESLQNRN